MKVNSFVYILECKNGTLYSGMTMDIKKRYKQHLSGKGSKFTKINKCITLVYIEELVGCSLKNTRSKARKREIQLKKFTRKKKLELVESNKDNTKKLIKKYGIVVE